MKHISDPIGPYLEEEKPDQSSDKSGGENISSLKIDRKIRPVSLSITDLLSVPALLCVTFQNKKFRNCVDVIFVDHDGKPISENNDVVMQRVGVSLSVPMPSSKKNQILHFGSKGAVFVLSIDTKKTLSLSNFRSLGGSIVRAFEKEKFNNARVHTDGITKLCRDGKSSILQSFLHGLQSATYTFDVLKRTKKIDERALQTVCILGYPLSRKKTDQISVFVKDLVVAEHQSRMWIDLPAQSGCMNTIDMVRLVNDIVRSRKNVSVELIVGIALEEKGLGALWGVGKGSENPPVLAVLSYFGGSKTDPIIALVGKCVTFDTGGENLKSTDGIEDMKADMGGAAMVLATFNMIVRRKARVNVVVTLAIADNAVSGKSSHPKSVLPSYSGKTIEVLNTDAEGRLVLADGVSYTEKKFKPDYLITLATLTGAIIISLGNEFAGLFPKTDKISRIIEEASNQTWNKVWRQPLIEAEYIKLKSSEVADVTNMGGRPGGAITAAKFIMEEFTETTHAAHLDVAGVAASIMGVAVDCTGEKAKFSTGYGPALLWETVRLLHKAGK